MCVCVCERERERERESLNLEGKHSIVNQYNYTRVGRPVASFLKIRVLVQSPSRSTECRVHRTLSVRILKEGIGAKMHGSR